MRGIGIEEAAAIAAQELDRFLRCNRAAHDSLSTALERGHRRRRRQGLRHAIGYQEQGGHDADRQQHVERATREVDPEIADRSRPAAREPADQSDGDGHSGSGGKTRLHSDADHLACIAERRLTAIRLPARIGYEADRGVQREIWRDSCKVLRIERQQGLQPQKRIERDNSDCVEDQKRDGVPEPTLLDLWPDSRQTVERCFDRPEQLPQQRTLAGIDSCEISAQRTRQQADHGGKEGDLQPAGAGHEEATLLAGGASK